MARSFSNAKRLSSFFGNQLSVVVARRGLAAASQSGLSGNGAAMMQKGGEESSKSAPIVPDSAVNGYRRPEFRSNEVNSYLNHFRPFSTHLYGNKSQIPSMFSMLNRFSTGSAPSVNSHARPLSPHLSIYKPQSSSMFSISNRIAASFLSATVLLFYVLYLKTGLVCFTFYNFYQIFSGVAQFSGLLVYSAFPLILLHLLHSWKH